MMTSRLAREGTLKPARVAYVMQHIIAERRSSRRAGANSNTIKMAAPVNSLFYNLQKMSAIRRELKQEQYRIEQLKNAFLELDNENKKIISDNNLNGFFVVNGFTIFVSESGKYAALLPKNKED